MTAIILQFSSMTKTQSPPPNRIREWRIRRDMTQEELAVQMGIKQNHLSRLESGTLELTLSRLQLFAKALGVDVGQLLAPEDNRFGLDEDAQLLLQKVQDDPGLAQPLLQLADTIATYRREEPAEPVEKVVSIKRRGPNRR